MGVCAAAVSHGPQLSLQQARHFFETHFQPCIIRAQPQTAGLFTGYFEPEVQGARRQNERFTVPIYGKPVDLVAFDQYTENHAGLRYGRLLEGKPQSYFSRKEIEQGALAGQGLEIAWLSSWQDAFFIHVQGSGRVKLPDGSVLRLAYAAKSGQPYTSIGAVLVDRGEIDKEKMSMRAILEWMSRNPHKARELMWENKSFVFFREVTLDDPALGPPGAQQVQLTPWRSLAVDRRFWSFGTPIWLETNLPPEAGGASIQRLMIAQDTGTAIKGAIRGDIFFGAGEAASHIAGHMKSSGAMIVLLPKTLAEDLTRMNSHEQ